MQETSAHDLAAPTALAEQSQAGVSQRKREANRQNALKSTGPRTERGKNVSRHNAAKHGILGSALFLKAKEKAEYKRLVQSLREPFRPEGAYEEFLVEEIAVCALRRKYLYRYESGEMHRQVELARREFRERYDTISPESRELLACFKKAKADIKRFGVLRGETAQSLESVMQAAALQEFHRKLAKAGLPDLPEQGQSGSAPDQLSGATTDANEALRRKEKLKVINEYMEPLQSACAEEIMN
ncbi:MAG TPA: hypothetical protein VF011_21285 [Terriglobales bacterium]